MEQREIKFKLVDKLESRILNIVGFIFETPTQIRFWYRKGEILVNESIAAHNAGIVQFTGLKDNWKEEIWEGHIVKILYTDWPSKTNDDPRTLDQYLEDIAIPGEIVFHEGAFCLKCDNVKFGGQDYLSLHPGAHGFIKVIGNKFQHPHLLTQPA